jgi:hypothetical protein
LTFKKHDPFKDATRPNTKTGNAIWSLANNGLDFLDSRTEFWRQQKPIYARKKMSLNSSSQSNKNPLDYILKQLEVIDNCNKSFISCIFFI